MRKVFWFGCAVVVAAAVGVYAMAWYVQHRPHSPAARMTQAAWYTVMVDWNPAIVVGRHLASRMSELMPKPKKHPEHVRATEAATCTPAAAPEACEPPAVIEVIDLSDLTGTRPMAPRSQHVPPSEFPLHRQPDQSIVVEVVPPGGIEEAEPFKEMPPADDDESVQKGDVSWWIELFRDQLVQPEQLPMPDEVGSDEPADQPPDEDTDEDTDDEPAQDVVGSDPANEEEMPAEGPIPDCHRNSCPYGGTCPRR